MGSCGESAKERGEFLSETGDFTKDGPPSDLDGSTGEKNYTEPGDYQLLGRI